MLKDTGPSVRIHGLASNLAAIGHQVRVVIPKDKSSEKLMDGVVVQSVRGIAPRAVSRVFSKLLGVSRPTALFFYDLLFVFRVGRIIHDYDLVQVEQQSAAALFIPLVRILKKPLVLDCHDVFQALRVRHTSAFRKILETFLEKVAYRNADLIVTVSENEKQCLVSRGAEEDKVTVIPNGVNTEIFSRRERCGSGIALDGKRTVIFVGNMEYLPNREAVHLIDAEIAPRVKKAVPNVRFLVVGRADNSIKSENLVFAGVVNNVVDFLATSDVAIAPLLHGSGTRLKILEYFSCGLPVVSTTVGVEGLDVKSGVHALVEDNMDRFAIGVIKLLKDRELAIRLGKTARELVVNNYDWKEITMQLSKAYRNLLLGIGN